MNNVWDKKHQAYSTKEWVNSANIFAETVLPYLKDAKSLLDLGAGQGQDSRFFASKGLKVTSTDISAEALKINKEKSGDTVVVEKLDLAESFPYKDSSFDVVYAHLGLHYFPHDSTLKLFQEIKRVVKAGGIFACLLNSTEDPEYGAGKKLEDDYFYVDNKPKRFFSTKSLKEYIEPLGFEILLLDNKGETYKDREKGVGNLIRFIGRPK